QGRPGIHQCDSPQSSPGIPAMSAAATYKHTLSPMGRVSTVILVLLPSRKPEEEGTPAAQKKAFGPPKCLNDKFDTPIAGDTNEDADDQLARQQRLVARTVCFTFGAIQQRHFFSNRDTMDITRLDPVAPRTTFVFYDPNTIFPDLDVDTSGMSSQELAKLEAARVYPEDHNDFFACLRLFCDATISQLAQSMLDEQNVKKEADDGKKYKLNQQREQSWSLKKRLWTGKKKGQAIWDWRLNQEAFYYKPENGALQGQERDDLLKMSTYARKSGKSSRQDQWSAMTGMDPPNRGWWRRMWLGRKALKEDARAVGPFDIDTDEDDPKEDHLVSFSHIRGTLLGNLVLRMAFVSATTPLTLPKKKKGTDAEDEAMEENSEEVQERLEEEVEDTQDRDDKDIGEPLGSSVSHRIAAYKKHQREMITASAVAAAGEDSVKWERYNSRKHLIQTENWLYTQMSKHSGEADTEEEEKLIEVMTSGEDMFLDEWYSDLQLPRLAYEVDEKKLSIPKMSLPPRVEWVVIGLPLASPSLMMAATAPVDIAEDIKGEEAIKIERKKKRMPLLYTAVSNVLVQEVGAQGIIRYFDHPKHGYKEALEKPWFGMDPFYDVYGDFINDKGFRAHDQKARWKIAKWAGEGGDKENKMKLLGRTPGFREMGIPFLSTNCLLGVTPENAAEGTHNQDSSLPEEVIQGLSVTQYPKGKDPPIAKTAVWHFTQDCARLMLG
ncbi:unnamed protein product, partial [Amoebophrya sp. A25]